MNTNTLNQNKDLILNFISENNFNAGDTLPSIRQIQSLFLMSKYMVMSTLKQLCDEGYIEKGDSARNGYRIIKLPCKPSDQSAAAPVSLVQFILPFKGWNFVGNQLLSAVERAFSLKNCNIIFSNNNNSVETEQKLLQSILTSPAAVKPKALLLMPSNSISNPSVELLKLIQQHIPIILVDRYIWGFDCHYVGLDNQNAGRIALERFYGSGRKNLAFVGGFSTISPVLDRMSGFLSAMKAKGCTVDEKNIFLDVKLDLGFLSDIQPQVNAIGEKLLNLTPKPTGIFCSSDRIAAALTNYFLSHGVSVPDDIAIIGCDNDTELTSACPLTITSFSHPYKEIADTIYQISNSLQNRSEHSYCHIEYTPAFIQGKTLK